MTATPATPHIRATPLAVVGIGASAGGLAALRELFGLVRPNTGLAYVVVVHLSPHHESHYAELLQYVAAIPVQQVRGLTRLEPDSVYVIPPGRKLSAIASHLRLSPAAELARHRAPIDHFFETMAATHDGHSIGVVLSGGGSDGSAGLQAIKRAGGYIIVQQPAEAAHPAMPSSAIDAVAPDRLLSVAQMPDAFVELAALSREQRGRLQSDAGEFFRNMVQDT